MKKKIRFVDNINNKETVTEVNIPAKDHLEAQKKFKAVVFKPKKGKGSFRRNKTKVVAEEE